MCALTCITNIPKGFIEIMVVGVDTKNSWYELRLLAAEDSVLITLDYEPAEPHSSSSGTKEAIQALRLREYGEPISWYQTAGCRPQKHEAPKNHRHLFTQRHHIFRDKNLTRLPTSILITYPVVDHQPDQLEAGHQKAVPTNFPCCHVAFCRCLTRCRATSHQLTSLCADTPQAVSSPRAPCH